MRYPVHVSVDSPARHERVQLAVRLAIAIALGFIGFSAGWFAALLYVVLPVIAAVSLSSGGAPTYVADTGPRVWRILAWALRFSAYMMLLVDRFPADQPGGVNVEVEPTAKPTAGRAVLRLLTSLPSAIVLCFLTFFSGIFCLVSWITVLVAERVPHAILRYQLGILRWQARLIAYHASLVDEYPPFAFSAGDDVPRATALHGSRG